MASVVCLSMPAPDRHECIVCVPGCRGRPRRAIRTRRTKLARRYRTVDGCEIARVLNSRQASRFLFNTETTASCSARTLDAALERVRRRAAGARRFEFDRSGARGRRGARLHARVTHAKPVEVSNTNSKRRSRREAGRLYEN